MKTSLRVILRNLIAPSYDFSPFLTPYQQRGVKRRNQIADLFARVASWAEGQRDRLACCTRCGHNKAYGLPCPDNKHYDDMRRIRDL